MRGELSQNYMKQIHIPKINAHIMQHLPLSCNNYIRNVQMIYKYK